ncbi:DNA topoisomerase 2-beta [Nymphon striatum]|nr:DNA topoisomerase 2-beta [Nymphon striatum]
MVDNDGHNLQQFQIELDGNKYKDEILLNSIIGATIDRERSRVVQSVMDCITARLASIYEDPLYLACHIFDHKNWPDRNNRDALLQYGSGDIQVLYDHFSVLLQNTGCDIDIAKSEWKDLKLEENSISVWNNGKGIPVIMHKEENVFVPSMIFGILLTSSNYDDDQEKVTDGRNDFGAKLCNVFSTEFTVETACNGKKFKQVWTNNTTKTKKPKITSHKGNDYTTVTFKPDLEKFNMESLDKDIIDLLSRRAYDIAGCIRGIKVFLNGKRLAVKNFEDYCKLYVKNRGDDDMITDLKLYYDNCSPRWEVAFAVSDNGFQQTSFVNGIATTKGGRHVDHIVDQLVVEIAEKIKNHMWVFVNCLIENPMFDSQTKENMTLPPKSFGSKCTMSKKYYKSVAGSGVIDSITRVLLDKKCSDAKKSNRNVNKHDSAKSIECTLVLTDGMAAMTLAISRLSLIGSARYVFYPLRGTLLNVRQATFQQILNNKEIIDLVNIIGLKFTKKYKSPEDIKSLNYGKIMIMTDQDQDGSHNKGLIINFIHYYWPNLLRMSFLEVFITPIIKVTKNKVSKPFYSFPEYEEWKSETPNWKTYNITDYKELFVVSLAFNFQFIFCKYGNNIT